MEKSSEKFRKILDELNLDIEIITFQESTKTSQEAAEQLKIDIAQIGKSIIFKTTKGQFVLIITSGANRINEKKIENIINDSLLKPTPKEIKDYVGYTIGGIPPFGHDNPLIVFLDDDLLGFNEIFCAGGTPNAVFKINPLKLEKITKGEWINVK